MSNTDEINEFAHKLLDKMSQQKECSFCLSEDNGYKIHAFHNQTTVYLCSNGNLIRHENIGKNDIVHFESLEELIKAIEKFLEKQ
jgi:hypothetical protein